MANSSIREFTCNDCQEVTKVDWSKVEETNENEEETKEEENENV